MAVEAWAPTVPNGKFLKRINLLTECLGIHGEIADRAPFGLPTTSGVVSTSLHQQVGKVTRTYFARVASPNGSFTPAEGDQCTVAMIPFLPGSTAYDGHFSSTVFFAYDNATV